jgi:hypothetical protein
MDFLGGWQEVLVEARSRNSQMLMVPRAYHPLVRLVLPDVEHMEVSGFLLETNEETVGVWDFLGGWQEVLVEAHSRHSLVRLNLPDVEHLEVSGFLLETMEETVVVWEAELPYTLTGYVPDLEPAVGQTETLWNHRLANGFVVEVPVDSPHFHRLEVVLDS